MIHGYDDGAQHVLRYVCPRCETSKPLLSIDSRYWAALKYEGRCALLDVLEGAPEPDCLDCKQGSKPL